jgi:hypothetical protein
MQKHIVLLLALAAAAVLSCQNQTSTTTLPVMPGFVEPQVVSVSADGKQATVNIGVMDKIRPAEMLYVVRNNRLVGMLSVRKPSTYTSDCTILASKSMTTMPPGSAVTLGNIAAGDHVVKNWPSVAPAGLMHDQVQEKVSVTIPSDNATTPGKTILVPRDQYDQWMKDHPPKPMVPTMGPSN